LPPEKLMPPLNVLPVPDNLSVFTELGMSIR